MSPTPLTTNKVNDVSVDHDGALLSVANVGFDYDNTPILDEVSLTVDRGEFVALVGPSGCGKSTLLNLISGVLPARSGAIRTGNRVIRSDRLGNVSYMQQKDLLLPWRSVAENSRLGIELRGAGHADSMEQVERLSRSFGLADVLDMMPWQLSGGMRQRAALLRAVLPDNPVLLLDEPFAGVDPISVIDIQRIIRQLTQRGIGVLITDHNVRETLGICGRAYILNEGALIASGSPDEILSNQNVRQVYLGENFTL